MMYYKRKWGCLGFFCLLILGGLLFFECVWNQENTKNEVVVSFSEESGFYGNAFWLELSNDAGGGIYYTLDGSIPNKSSIEYKAPIWICDASENENVYSMITDVSTGFYTEEIEKINLEAVPGYQAPDYKVDKATVIRAVTYDEWGNRSDVATSTYYVGYADKNGYDGMKVLSVITEPEGLFGYETGIYVTGKEYAEYVKDYRNTGEWYWREGFYTLWRANYRNRGIKWEREALCQFFAEDGTLEFAQKCGIRVHGGSSRAGNPKSLNIYARKEYSGDRVLTFDFWKTGYYPDAMTLFQGGNEPRVKAKDYLVANEIRDLKVSSMNFEPYVMFLNGEYWGVYWLNEKYDANYLGYYYGVDAQNVILIKEGEMVEGEDGDKKYYSDMIKFCSESDLTKAENYQKVSDLIDMESYIDYYALMVYLGRCEDWPSGNYALWRVKKQEAGQYGDGKWRWMVFDLNSAGFYSTFDSLGYVMENDGMFCNMMTNDEFKNEFLIRLEEMAELFQYKKMETRIEEYRMLLAENMKVDDKRFYGDDSGACFDAELDGIRSFFQQRGDYLATMIEHYK